MYILHLSLVKQESSLFQQASSVKSFQASFIYAWSLQRMKLCWIKPKTPHKSSSTILWKQIKGTLQSIKSPNLVLQYTPKFPFLQSMNLGLIRQINQVTIYQLQEKNHRIVLFFWKEYLDRDCTWSYI